MRVLLCTVEKSRFSRISLNLSHRQSWVDTLSIGVECDAAMEGLEDYKNPVKVLPQAVLVSPTLRYRRRSLLWMKMLGYKNLAKQAL
jgi:hypothetical protein